MEQWISYSLVDMLAASEGSTSHLTGFDVQLEPLTPIKLGRLDRKAVFPIRVSSQPPLMWSLRACSGQGLAGLSGWTEGSISRVACGVFLQAVLNGKQGGEHSMRRALLDDAGLR